MLSCLKTGKGLVDIFVVVAFMHAVVTAAVCQLLIFLEHTKEKHLHFFYVVDKSTIVIRKKMKWELV